MPTPPLVKDYWRSIVYLLSPCLPALCSSSCTQKENKCFCSSGMQHKKNLIDVVLHEIWTAQSPWLLFILYSSLIELYLKRWWFNRGNNPGTLPRIVFYIETPAFQCVIFSEHFRAGTTLSYWTLIETLAFEHRKQSWAGHQDCFLCSNANISMWYLLWAFQSRYNSFLNFNWNAGIWIEETNNPGTLPRVDSYVQTPAFQCGTCSNHFRAGTTLHKFFIQLIELPKSSSSSSSSFFHPLPFHLPFSHIPSLHPTSLLVIKGFSLG